jgi:protein-S-isoprenylcysteine O-methyltransferase Ste14
LRFFQNDTLGAIWLVFGVLWFLPAIFGKRTIQRQTSGSRLLQIILILIAYRLLFRPALPWDVLNLRLVPATTSATVAGYSLLAAGMLFACWARVFLGGNWSASVTLKQDHTLVRSGPYSIVRHPIYTGLLLAMLGTAIAVGELRCFLGVGLAAIAWKLKSLTEEALMVQQFGDQYARYRMEVKALVPYLW